mmetsp:Transcript_34109/g.98178  ORF Transcript_34109/g.98178 Transcript_34109/m.98178 type:complete len:241 (+) Transcript_34109:234-956(+)
MEAARCGRHVQQGGRLHGRLATHTVGVPQELVTHCSFVRDRLVAVLVAHLAGRLHLLRGRRERPQQHRGRGRPQQVGHRWQAASALPPAARRGRGRQPGAGGRRPHELQRLAALPRRGLHVHHRRDVRPGPQAARRRHDHLLQPVAGEARARQALVNLAERVFLAALATGGDGLQPGLAAVDVRHQREAATVVAALGVHLGAVPDPLKLPISPGVLPCRSAGWGRRAVVVGPHLALKSAL